MKHNKHTTEMTTYIDISSIILVKVNHYSIFMKLQTEYECNYDHNNYHIIIILFYHWQQLVTATCLLKTSYIPKFMGAIM